MEDELQGTLCQAPNNCVQIRQSLWDPNGIATIEATIDATPDTKVVFSYSEGARSVTKWLELHADDPDAPSPDELSFVLIGNPTRAHGGSDDKVMPQTQYQVVDISRQYDPASDFPDDATNLIAVLNSLAAFTVIHTDYEGVDMYDPANIVWKEGNTTYVFVPTEKLPLLEPLRKLGLTSLADALNQPLKEIVERAYDRSYLPTAEQGPASTSALSRPLASAPAVRAVASKPGPPEIDGDDSTVSETRAAASPSDAQDSSAVDQLPISAPRETDEVDVDVDEPAPSADGVTDSTSVDAQETSPETTADEVDVDVDDPAPSAGGVTDSTSVDAQETSPETTADDERTGRTTASARVSADQSSKDGTRAKAGAEETDRDSVSAGETSSTGDA